MSRCQFCTFTYLGVLLVERVAYDFSVSLFAPVSRRLSIIVTIYVVFFIFFRFGHVFFRANANCRLYQTADSTETPLLAQVLSLLSFSFAFFYHQPLVIVLSHAWPEYLLNILHIYYIQYVTCQWINYVTVIRPLHFVITFAESFE